MIVHRTWRRRLLVLAAVAGLLVVRVSPAAAESRDEWQQPDRVMADLGLKPGDIVADVGCGTGYFTFRMAAAVGEQGKVCAVDVDAAALGEVRRRAEREKATSVEIVQSEPTDTKLKAGSVRAVLLCDVIHEVPQAQRAGLMKSIATALKPGGYLFFIDYRKSRDVTFDPYERLVPRDELVKLATDAGLVLDAEFFYLRYQVFFRFRKPAAGPAEKAAAQSPSPAISPEPAGARVVLDTHDGRFLSNGSEAGVVPSPAVVRGGRPSTPGSTWPWPWRMRAASWAYSSMTERRSS
jgi:ubiquinone/menaquinone biosynthesis C-methylase UbiE